jgi:putative thiamine transport system substrate-binding protein
MARDTMIHAPTSSHLPSRRQALTVLAGVAATPLLAQSSSTWAAIESRARGQTVYFNAWAGSERINAYLQWAAAELQRTMA